MVVLVASAHDAGDVHALPLQVDGLRGLLEPLAHYLEGGLAELGLDLLERLPAGGRHDGEVRGGKGRGIGINNPEGLGRGARGKRQESEKNLHGTISLLFRVSKIETDCRRTGDLIAFYLDWKPVRERCASRLRCPSASRPIRLRREIGILSFILRVGRWRHPRPLQAIIGRIFGLVLT